MENEELIEQAVKEQAEEQPEAAAKVDELDEHDREEMLAFIRNEERALVDDIVVEDATTKLPNAFDDLRPHHFPLFLTVKRLIYMMDACLSYSFFSRDHNNNIVGMDQNLGWHNETRGVMMINHYFKESIDYDQQLAKFGKEILEMDKDAEVETGGFESGLIEEEDLGGNFRLIQEKSTTGGSNLPTYNNRIPSKSSQGKYFIEK